ncbi:uncharacterized protein LOC111089218 [Limulus polyphemus]|uniref:Uncharacterized protein LOC111089218 n=1 Tax=Limulus polyphemus TaxID=6850 RepID=A0ABM1TMA5_LIMPO|nr:uncharacterized protein LOC111089218 [Limulus polyphemus]
MDFQSAMETFAEAWVAAITQTPLTEAAVEAQCVSWMMERIYTWEGSALKGVLCNQATTATAHPNGPTVTLQDLSDRREHVQEGSESGGSSGLRSPSSHLPSSSVFGDFRSSHHSRMPLLGPEGEKRETTQETRRRKEKNYPGDQKEKRENYPGDQKEKREKLPRRPEGEKRKTTQETRRRKEKNYPGDRRIG